jgi:hypothetical protein
MSGIALLDDASNAGVLPFLMKDLNGTTLVTAENAWILKVPNVEYTRDATSRVWILQTNLLIVNLGGNQ